VNPSLLQQVSACASALARVVDYAIFRTDEPRHYLSGERCEAETQ
jgi:hypothetical protein